MIFQGVLTILVFQSKCKLIMSIYFSCSSWLLVDSFPIPLHMLPSFLMIALRFLLVLPLRKRERQVASSLSHMVVNSIAISIYIAKPSRFDVLAAHLSIFVTVHGMKSFVARSIYMIQMYATRAEPQIVLPSTAWIIYSID